MGKRLAKFQQGNLPQNQQDWSRRLSDKILENPLAYKIAVQTALSYAVSNTATESTIFGTGTYFNGVSRDTVEPLPFIIKNLQNSNIFRINDILRIKIIGFYSSLDTEVLRLRFYPLGTSSPGDSASIHVLTLGSNTNSYWEWDIHQTFRTTQIISNVRYVRYDSISVVRYNDAGTYKTNYIRNAGSNGVQADQTAYFACTADWTAANVLNVIRSTVAYAEVI